MNYPKNRSWTHPSVRQACNRVRSSLTHRVGMSEGSELTTHRSLQRLISDQLRFLGLYVFKPFTFVVSRSVCSAAKRFWIASA
jgi:hypothetical protein